ncbi:MAG: efflux RND transporter periplasmic adaptor subunit, partial [Deltaproteobacteria bacterium]|nr:efflux RND transporter periplasmic adaptor subunit [Deltaproteobacteria bacterium]
MRSRIRRLQATTLAMLTCWALPGCGVEETPPEPVRPVLSVVVADAAGLNGRRFPGQAKATQELNLAFEVPGRLIERPVEVGDRVELGQVLAELDPRDFAAALKSAEAELKRDQANFERAEGMLAEDVISRAQYDRLEARRDIAEASVELAAKALADSVLRAPFSGTVAATYVENYENVRAKQEIMRLLDTSKIEMVIQIPESLISNTPYVRDIQVRFDPFPEAVLPASIKEVSNEASRTTRTYPVTLIMEPLEGVAILPGMAGEAWGRVELPEDLPESGIEVPTAAIFADDASDAEQSYVWVVDKEAGSVSRRPVKIVRFGGLGVLVQGVEPGE